MRAYPLKSAVEVISADPVRLSLDGNLAVYVIFPA